MKNNILLIFTLFIVFLSCNNPCEDLKDKLKNSTRPVIVYSKDPAFTQDGYDIVLIDKLGKTMLIIPSCTFADSIRANYNVGDTIKEF